MATVTNTVKLYADNGVDSVTSIKRSVNSDNARQKLDGRAEARLLEIACSPTPKGHSRWTLRLLEDEAKAALDTPVGKNAIGRALKNRYQPHRSEYWCIPKKGDAEFVAYMEDVLDVYEFPYDPQRPVVCMDEKLYQLLGDAREALPMRLGNIQKVDSEYVQQNGNIHHNGIYFTS